jgi:predicted small secreted protein
MKLFLTCVIASMTIFVASCNTIAGVGRDAQRAGEAVEDAAENNS